MASSVGNTGFSNSGCIRKNQTSREVIKDKRQTNQETEARATTGGR